MDGTKKLQALWQITEAHSYYNALLHEIPKAKKRVVIATMIFLSGEQVDRLMTLLGEAIERGVKVTILLDIGGTRSSLIYRVPGKSPRLKQTFTQLEALGVSGATVYSFGKLGLQPLKQRCHIKATIIDDMSYSFGGINLQDEAMDNTDYMIRSQNPDVADYLVKLVERIGKKGATQRDVRKTIGTEDILFDGGEPGHSIIYEQACELTSQAKRVYYVSQWTPSGDLGELLSEVDAQCYFNRPAQMIVPHSWAQAFDQNRSRIVNAYQGANYIHAKFMLFELKSGKKVALTGSNNFSYRGVAYGTREIALLSRDQALWEDLRRYITKNLANKTK